jgi:hypothetical protein
MPLPAASSLPPRKYWNAAPPFTQLWGGDDYPKHVSDHEAVSILLSSPRLSCHWCLVGEDGSAKTQKDGDRSRYFGVDGPSLRGCQSERKSNERSQEVIENKGDRFITNCKAKRYMKTNELFL